MATYNLTAAQLRGTNGEGILNSFEIPVGGGDIESMIFTITTTSPNENFIIRSISPSVNNYDVDWGDSNSESGVTDINKTHTYAIAGTYEIKITGDIYIRNSNTTTAAQYTEFKQWGTNTTIRGLREFFNECINMTYTATDAPNFNFTVAGSYKGPYRLFKGCDSIISLDLSNWDVSAFAGTTHQDAFRAMNNITSINLTGWDVSSTSNASNWFNGSGNSGAGLTITAPNLNWAACSNMTYMFYDANLTSATDITGWTLRAAGTSTTQMFRSIGNTAGQTGGCNLDLTGWINTSAFTSGANLFLASLGLSTVDLTNWDLSNITSCQSMFSNCYYLTDIIGLNTLRFDSATNMSYTFNNTYRLKFDTHDFHNDFGANWSVTTFLSCFYRNGYSLSAGSRGVIPNVTNWDTSNATSVYQMFRESYYEDSNQTFAPSTSWDLSSISSNSLKLFAYNTTGFQTWDWSNVTIPNTVTDMSSFISSNINPRTLTTVIFGANCDFSGVTTWSAAFNNQTSLTTLTFDSSVSFASVTTMSNMLTSSPLNITSYDNLLIRAAATNTNSVALSANQSSFTCAPSAAATAEGTLVAAGWTITDLACT
jgi:surface protein